MSIIVPLEGFGGGSNPLNFKVVGNPQPSNPAENTIWVNTIVDITSWHFGAEEPNVYNIQPIADSDPWNLTCPDDPKAGKIINFTIPKTVSGTLEAIRLYHAGKDKMYCVRQFDGSVAAAWPAGAKVSVMLSDETYKIGDWVGNGTARILAWEEYYHKEGTVWILTGTSSSTAFNALKKNGITVYPISAKQYVGGAWLDKTAKSYQGGAWTEWWNGVLFENADQYEDITGGWVKGTSYGNAGTTATIDDTGIKLSTVSGSFINVETVNKIDLSGHSTLHVDATVTSRTSSSANYLWLAYTESSGQAIHDSAAVPKASAKVTALGNVTLSLDVSTVDGEYFVVFGASVGGMGVTVNKIWLE